MNRIDATFTQLNKNNKTAFIAYITAGFPTLQHTEELVYALEQAGVDIIELGIPFSDPVADGPTIQLSSQLALERGVTLDQIFAMVKRIRTKSTIPLALMTYYNPVFYRGDQQFIEQMKRVGADGIIIPDLPPEEAGELIKHAKKNDIATVFFMAPTTRPERMKKIAKSSTGFIYYVSLTGVTGARVALPKNIATKIKEVKKHTSKPVCVGFGISTPEQVKLMAHYADGVIVGSAIIKEIMKHEQSADCVKHVGKFVATLTKVLK